MNEPEQTRDRAMHAFIAAVNSIVEHPGESANIVLARQAADAIAEHAIALRHRQNPEQLAIDAVDHPMP